MPSYEGLLTRFSERLSILNEVHSALLASLSVDELLDLVLDRVFNHLQPHQGAILLRDRRGRFYQARSRALPGYDRAFPRSHTLEHQVGENKLAALIPDLLQDSPLSGSDSVHQAGIQSLLAVPMLGMDPADDAIGIIALSSSSPGRRFDESDLELLFSLASVAAMRLINVSLAREAAERHRLARELTIARQIQVDLLPKRMPQIEGWEIFGSSHPSSVVSGDYYSVDRLEDGHYLLLIVDVAGRGIGASLLMGYLEAQLSCYLDEGLAPDVIFEKVSRRLHRRTREENFATAVLGFLDPQRQTFTYASAGHQPVLVVRGSGTVERAPSTGLPLGLFPDARYQTRAIALEPGDLAVLYTDGIIEAESREGLDYGVDRLAQVCSRHRRLGLLQLATVLEHDVDRFAAPHPVTDDRTLVMVRRLADA